MKRIVFVCEGYDDRAFLKGCIKTWFDFVDRPDFPDDLGKSRGHFVFESASSSAFLRIAPAHSVDKLTLEASLIGRRLLDGDRLVIVRDDDTDASAPPLDVVAVQRTVAATIVEKGAPEGVEAKVIAFRSESPLTQRLPSKQTLERVVCAALLRVDSTHGEDVHDWLFRTPARNQDVKLHKAHWLAHLAKWRGHLGSADTAYEQLWSIPEVATALRAELEASGAWQVLEACVR